MTERRNRRVSGGNAEAKGHEAMSKSARQEKILEMLESEGQVRITELAQYFNTSVVTIRSDLDAMDEAGLVERTSGGAVLTTITQYNRDFQKHKHARTEEKRAVAMATASRIQDGDTLFINSGSTTYFVALMLKKLQKRVTIVTNSVYIAMELGDTPGFLIIFVGGQINSRSAFTCGADALNQLRQYRVQHAILSIDGIDETGIATIHADEAPLAQLMMENARNRIVVADSSKVGKNGFCNISSLQHIDVLVSNKGCDAEVIRQIREAGVEIVLI